MDEGGLTERIGQIEERVAAMLQQETKLKIQNQQLKAKLAKRRKQPEEEGEPGHREYLRKSIANHEHTLNQYKQLYASLQQQHSSKSPAASRRGLYSSSG